jgi:hypothetical protein
MKQLLFIILTVVRYYLPPFSQGVFLFYGYGIEGNYIIGVVRDVNTVVFMGCII